MSKKIFDVKKYLKIRLLERREEDTWFDLGKRELRSGEVCFYKINDMLTGEWLIKTCLDNTKIILKANKCPSGHLISQLENQSMIFQKSLVSNMYYGVISTTYVDEKQRVRRKSINSLDDVPSLIRNFYDVKTYEEATGRKTRKNLVTLVYKNNVKDMMNLFIQQKAWPLLLINYMDLIQIMEIEEILKDLERVNIEDIYTKLTETIEVKEINKILDILERRGKIKYLNSKYIKIN